MALIKRLVKGSPLTFAEGDDNLVYLETLALNAATTGSNSFTGSQTVTGSVIATGGFTGSLQGTASAALNSTSASYWSGSIINAASASFATTASYALNVTSISTGSLATTGSNVFVGNQTITGSLKVTGSIEINNTNIQYYNPQSVLFLPSVYTLITSESTTYNVHVTQSGPYFIDCTNIPINKSCSVNFYVYPDLMPSGFIANINALAPISPSNNSNYINYKTIVSASNSTSYYQQSPSSQGVSTTVVSRGFSPKIAWVPLGNSNNSNMGWFFKTPANQVMLLAKPIQSEGNLQIGSVSYYLFTGSQGTPLA